MHARVIRPDRRSDLAGEPVDADIGEQPVAGVRGFDVAGDYGADMFRTMTVATETVAIACDMGILRRALV